ncbi:hypothetical protein KocCE7_02230 [Kocuria marina subsp. indica]|uniref:hypothetical protein n=1 Tax=Kocuria TaxID=57493 RepID=UPI00103E5F31|nr:MULTISPECIES: hypothetical protein [Kocuria]MDT0119056.1 hypothetical protein [Kocuria sp. PD6]QBJ20802.1 hypothetical protein KocCE7_02230 [Kocuria indica]
MFVHIEAAEEGFVHQPAHAVRGALVALTRTSQLRQRLSDHLRAKLEPIVGRRQLFLDPHPLHPILVGELAHLVDRQDPLGGQGDQATLLVVHLSKLVLESSEEFMRVSVLVFKALPELLRDVGLEVLVEP